MHDMFYNYDSDYRRNKKPNAPFAPECPSDDSLYTATGAVAVTDARGKKLGIRALYDQKTPLYFQISGAIDDEEPITYLNHCYLEFDLIDSYNNVILVKKYPVNSLDAFGVLEVIIDPVAEELKREVYKMQLLAYYVPENSNGESSDETTAHILFYRDDATLSFI